MHQLSSYPYLLKGLLLRHNSPNRWTICNIINVIVTFIPQLPIEIVAERTKGELPKERMHLLATTANFRLHNFEASFSFHSAYDMNAAQLPVASSLESGGSDAFYFWQTRSAGQEV